MKRRLLFILTAVALALVLALVFAPDSSVDFASFESRFEGALDRARYLTMSQGTGAPDLVPLPFSVRWKFSHWFREPTSHVEFGFPDAIDQYVVTQDRSSMIEFFVRHLDGRASFISIRAVKSSQAQAEALRSLLAREFPGLPIALSIQ